MTEAFMKLGCYQWQLKVTMANCANVSLFTTQQTTVYEMWKLFAETIQFTFQFTISSFLSFFIPMNNRGLICSVFDHVHRVVKNRIWSTQLASCKLFVTWVFVFSQYFAIVMFELRSFQLFWSSLLYTHAYIIYTDKQERKLQSLKTQNESVLLVWWGSPTV